MRNKRAILWILAVLLLCLTACAPGEVQSGNPSRSPAEEQTEAVGGETPTEEPENPEISQGKTETDSEKPVEEKPTDKAEKDMVTKEESPKALTVLPGETAASVSEYIDENGEVAIIPKGFKVSEREGEHTVKSGVVVIGPDGSEFVWVPTNKTALAVRDFGSYFYGGNISGYWDETDQALYQEMVKSVEANGGFYMGRFEASLGGGEDLTDYVPASKRMARPWVRFSPQDTAVICQNLYADNETVQGFFPWGINYDTTLQWFIDSGAKTEKEVTKDSTSWGNYSDDVFSKGADGSTTGQWEEASANNIYDMAGNNWEWTQERYGSGNYVMRGGGYNLMGGSCSGADYPAALRDPLPGNDHHPNVTFRVALFVKNAK